MLRIGCVPFVNALPLIQGLEKEMCFDDPATLTRKMLREELDIALLPTVDLLRYPQFEPFTHFVISSAGRVRSIRLLSAVPIADVRTYRRDPQSRSSNALLNILCQNHWKILVSESLDAADASLLIGDKALLAPPGRHDYDLGKVWTDWTGLPFVYATWVKRAGLDTQAWEQKLNLAYENGQKNMTQIVTEACRRIAISPQAAWEYFNNCMRYQANAQSEMGLRRFYHELATLEDLPAYRPEFFWDTLEPNRIK